MKELQYVAKILEYCYANDWVLDMYSISGETSLTIHPIIDSDTFQFYYRKCSDFSLAWDSLLKEHSAFKLNKMEKEEK